MIRLLKPRAVPEPITLNIAQSPHRHIYDSAIDCVIDGSYAILQCSCGWGHVCSPDGEYFAKVKPSLFTFWQLYGSAVRREA